MVVLVIHEVVSVRPYRAIGALKASRFVDSHAAASTIPTRPTLRQIGIRTGHSCRSSLNLVPRPRSHQHAPDAHDGIRQQRVLSARSETRRGPPASSRRRDFPRPCRRISCAIRKRRAARSRARASPPRHVSVQVNPDPAGGAPQPTGTGNVTAMFSRGYIELLFKTADTPLGRELDAAMARYPGVHLAAFAVDDAAEAHRRLAAAGLSGAAAGRHAAPGRHRRRRRNRGLHAWRGSSRARCRKAASKSSPTTPSAWSGSRAGSRIRTARSRLSSVTIAVADVDGGGAALRALHRPRCRAASARPDDRARPRPRRSRHRRRVRADAARGFDPVAAVHRRLRHQGEVAGRTRRPVGARRRAKLAARASSGRALSRRNSATAPGCSRNDPFAFPGCRFAYPGYDCWDKPDRGRNAQRLPILFHHRKSAGAIVLPQLTVTGSRNGCGRGDRRDVSWIEPAGARMAPMLEDVPAAQALQRRQRFRRCQCRARPRRQDRIHGFRAHR